jgi:rhamnose transport system permease protein
MSANSERNANFVSRFANWDNFLALLTIAVIAYALLGVPNFASSFNISQAVAGISERALIVLPMVLLIIAREIDLSVGSILALTSVVFGLLTQSGAPLFSHRSS